MCSLPGKFATGTMKALGTDSRVRQLESAKRLVMLKKYRSAAACFATCFALIVCALLIPGCDRKAASPSPSAGPLPPLPPLSPTQMANDRILKELSEPTEIDFVETPLKDFAEAIQIRHS